MNRKRLPTGKEIQRMIEAGKIHVREITEEQSKERLMTEMELQLENYKQFPDEDKQLKLSKKLLALSRIGLSVAYRKGDPD